MRRREFIAGLGAAAPWIIRSAHAQQAESERSGWGSHWIRGG